MKIEPIQTIIEGCNKDTITQLQYITSNAQIPENAQHLIFNHQFNSQRYLLYATYTDQTDITIQYNPHYEQTQDPSIMLKGGFPLNDLIDGFNWIFESQRSLITKDRRIYIGATYFVDNWRWYLEKVPTIINQCKQIFQEQQ